MSKWTVIRSACKPGKLINADMWLRIFYYGMLILLPGIIFFYQLPQMIRLKKKGIVITAVVKDVWLGHRRSAVIEYEFSLNGKIYRTKDKFNLSTAIKKHIVGKRVPLLVLPDKPGVSNLLLLKAQFDNIGKPFPDSLQWIERYTHFYSP